MAANRLEPIRPVEFSLGGFYIPAEKILNQLRRVLTPSLAKEATGKLAF